MVSTSSTRTSRSPSSTERSTYRCTGCQAPSSRHRPLSPRHRRRRALFRRREVRACRAEPHRDRWAYRPLSGDPLRCDDRSPLRAIAQPSARERSTDPGERSLDCRDCDRARPRARQPGRTFRSGRRTARRVLVARARSSSTSGRPRSGARRSRSSGCRRRRKRGASFEGLLRERRSFEVTNCDLKLLTQLGASSRGGAPSFASSSGTPGPVHGPRRS